MDLACELLYTDFARQGASVRGQGRSHLIDPSGLLRPCWPAVRTRALTGGRSMSPSLSLPAARHLDFVRNDAKHLVRLCRAQDALALERVRAALPRLSSLD